MNGNDSEIGLRENEVVAPEGNNGAAEERLGIFKIDTSIELRDFKGEKMRTQIGVKEDADENAILDAEGKMIPTFGFMTVGLCLYVALGAFKEKTEPSMKVKRWRGLWKKKVADALNNGDPENPTVTGDTFITLTKLNVSFLTRQIHLAYPLDTNIIWAIEEILDPGCHDIDLDGEEPE